MLTDSPTPVRAPLGPDRSSANPLPSALPLRPLGRRVELDGLRGLAIAVVFATHLFHSQFRGGAVGVDVFFVLSGFLITAPLLVEWHDRGSISFRAFWIRRSLRLLPALALFVPFAAAAAIAVGDSIEVVNRSILGTGLYFMNFLQAGRHEVASTFSHTWSLALEEQFYLVWPVLFVAIMSRASSRLTIVRWACLPIVLLPIWRTILYVQGAGYTRIKVGPDTRIDMLAIGCLLAMVWCYELAPGLVSRLRLALLPAILFMAAVVVFGGPQWLGHLAAWGWSAIGLASAVLILNALDSRNRCFRTILRWRPLTWLGRMSYGLYLWHFVILALVRSLMPSLGVMAVAGVTVTASVGMAALSWRFVEEPFLDLKGRLVPNITR